MEAAGSTSSSVTPKVVVHIGSRRASNPPPWGPPTLPLRGPHTRTEEAFAIERCTLVPSARRLLTPPDTTQSSSVMSIARSTLPRPRIDRQDADLHRSRPGLRRASYTGGRGARGGGTPHHYHPRVHVHRQQGSSAAAGLGVVEEVAATGGLGFRPSRPPLG
jgi:hypothetical protein